MTTLNDVPKELFRTIEIKCEYCDFFTTSDNKFNVHVKKGRYYHEFIWYTIFRANKMKGYYNNI